MARGPRRIAIIRDGKHRSFVELAGHVVEPRHISAVQNNPAGGCSVTVAGHDFDCPEVPFSELAAILQDA